MKNSIKSKAWTKIIRLNRKGSEINRNNLCNLNRSEQQPYLQYFPVKQNTTNKSIKIKIKQHIEIILPLRL